MADRAYKAWITTGFRFMPRSNVPTHKSGIECYETRIYAHASARERDTVEMTWTSF